jgi:four helix bundle protein
MRDFKNLQVWSKSHQLTLSVYQETGTFPDSERYGLTSQMRRAAASVAANIAEGYGRESDREFLRFLHISAGSATELEYHILLASDLGYLEDDVYRSLNDRVLEVQRMLAGLIRRIKNSPQ